MDKRFYDIASAERYAYELGLRERMVRKYNQSHDPETGRFTETGTGVVAGGTKGFWRGGGTSLDQTMNEPRPAPKRISRVTDGLKSLTARQVVRDSPDDFAEYNYNNRVIRVPKHKMYAGLVGKILDAIDELPRSMTVLDITVSRFGDKGHFTTNGRDIVFYGGSFNPLSLRRPESSL